MKRSTRCGVGAVLLVIVSGAACSGARARTGTEPAAAAQGTSSTARGANPADVHFMSGMIHHHAQALVMAGWAATNGASAAIRTLCERILVSQTDEIKLLQQWLREQGEPAPEATPGGLRMVMDGVEHEMLMPGMLSEAQMAELERARGPEFDRLFLRGMIQHHAGALVMVDELFASYGGGVDTFIYKFASDTYADQGSEIGRMQSMLETMAGRSP